MSLQLVSENRLKNISAVIPLLNDKSLLESYHPNYKKDNFKKLEFGENKGELLPRELADILEKDVSINNADLNSPMYTTDVLVIGGGGAGAAAAIEAYNAGAKVIIATKFRFGDSNTALAKGGISAAVSADDSADIHYSDTFNGGHKNADPELLRVLTENACDGIKWLEGLGVNFDKTADGNYNVNLGGGATVKRLLSVKDYTGAQIMKALKNAVLSKDISVLENMAAVSLVIDNKKCKGAVFLNGENRLVFIKANAVILATGGCGGLCCGGFPTSNCHGITGDGLRLAYRVGAKLKGAESLQYHPTGAMYPDSFYGQLITEKARSLGARLVNAKGECFVNSLETRDTVTAAIIRECELGLGVKTEKGAGVWLDTPMIDLINGEGTICEKLPSLYKMFLGKGIDITKTPILVYPTLHYQNGGLLINSCCETTVKNLFAAGEITGGIHGKNRLMGNSLSDIIVFGRIAGKNAAKCREV